MANLEHEAELWKGVETWNQWRNNNPLVRPELYEADFSAVNLSKANLSRANLRESTQQSRLTRGEPQQSGCSRDEFHYDLPLRGEFFGSTAVCDTFHRR